MKIEKTCTYCHKPLPPNSYRTRKFHEECRFARRKADAREYSKTERARESRRKWNQTIKGKACAARERRKSLNKELSTPQGRDAWADRVMNSIHRKEVYMEQKQEWDQ